MIGPKMIHPASNCFVGNYNSTLREQILDVTKAEREPEIEPDRLVNDHRRGPISGVPDFRHALWLPSRRRRDNAARRSALGSSRSCRPAQRRGLAPFTPIWATAIRRGRFLSE